MGILDGQLKPIPQGYTQAFWEYQKSQSPALSGNLYSGVGGGYGNISLLGNDDDNDVEVTPSATTTSEAATTKTPPQVSQVDATKAAQGRSAESYTDYVTAVNEGRKAYQELVKESLKRKQALADKKVRSDRSTALANALGSLVNVFTAYGMAKKGGYAPIIAEYDSTPDTELKKSIAARYALENENEGLLMQLVKDRINSEAEIAKGKYERDVKYADAIAKAAIGEAKAAQDLYKWEKSEENKDRRAEANRKQKAEVTASEKARTTQEKALEEGKKAFVQAINKDKKIQRREGSNRYVLFDMSANQGVKSNFEKIYEGLNKKGLSAAQMDIATEYIKKWWESQPNISEILKQETVTKLIAKATEEARKK